jgi:hypothetical protein
MSQVYSPDVLGADRSTQAHAFAEAIIAGDSDQAGLLEPLDRREATKRPPVSRHTPRVSLIVVLPEHHVVSPDQLAQSLRGHENKAVDIVVACAGQPTNLSALQRSVGEAQFLLAPAGTSVEDLRELAIRQVPGDIVTLLSGALLPEVAATGELFMSS